MSGEFLPTHEETRAEVEAAEARMEAERARAEAAEAELRRLRGE